MISRTVDFPITSTCFLKLFFIVGVLEMPSVDEAVLKVGFLRQIDSK